MAVRDPNHATAEELAEPLGLTTTASVRKTLHRLGISAVAREPGKGGANLYDRAAVLAAAAARPGQGRGGGRPRRDAAD